jgi:hypothetical protein
MSTLVHACPSFVNLFDVGSGFGQDFLTLDGMISQAKSRNEYAITWQQSARVRDELIGTFEACSVENWDGYGAEPISYSSISDALIFVETLPSSIPTPEVIPEPDGEVALEWYVAKDRMFVVGFDGSGKISYSGILGPGETVLGSERSTEIFSQTIVESLEKVFGRCL